MNHSKISVRYAKALFELASEQGTLDAIRNDMNLVDAVASQSPEFQNALKSPVLSLAEKKKLFSATFASVVNPLSVKFFELLLANKREAFLRDIARNFLSEYKKLKGIQSVHITSAAPLSQSSVDTMVNAVKQAYGKEIELSTEVSQELIGGFVLRIEDSQLDASVAGMLKRVRRELLEKK